MFSEGLKGLYLYDRQKDLRGRGAQGHEGEVGHRLVPDAYCGDLDFTVGFSDGHLFLLEGQMLESRLLLHNRCIRKSLPAAHELL